MQSELSSQSDLLTKFRNNIINQTIEGEISIHIGRNGELIFHDGRNRLSIAKILGLDSIPVVVLVRHKQWQDTRDRLTNDNSREEPTHPDLI